MYPTWVSSKLCEFILHIVANFITFLKQQSLVLSCTLIYLLLLLIYINISSIWCLRHVAGHWLTAPRPLSYFRLSVCNSNQPSVCLSVYRTLCPPYVVNDRYPWTCICLFLSLKESINNKDSPNQVPFIHLYLFNLVKRSHPVCTLCHNITF